jgi:predicted nucleic acid-binding protein
MLATLLERDDVAIFITGSILQEVLQGFPDAGRSRRLTATLDAYPILELARADYVFAAEIRNLCRGRGVQVGTIDAQIAAAAIRNRATLLTADPDFARIARQIPLELA